MERAGTFKADRATERIAMRDLGPYGTELGIWETILRDARRFLCGVTRQHSFDHSCGSMDRKTRVYRCSKCWHYRVYDVDREPLL